MGRLTFVVRTTYSAKISVPHEGSPDLRDVVLPSRKLSIHGCIFYGIIQLV
jgi:hypothetical protein